MSMHNPSIPWYLDSAFNLQGSLSAPSSSHRSVSVPISPTSDVYSDGADSVPSTLPSSPITPSSTHVLLHPDKPSPFYPSSSLSSPCRAPSPVLYDVEPYRPDPFKLSYSLPLRSTGSSDEHRALLTLPGSRLPTCGTQSFIISLDEGAAAHRWCRMLTSTREGGEHLCYELTCHRFDAYGDALAQDADTATVGLCWPTHTSTVIALSVLSSNADWNEVNDPKSYHDFLIEPHSPFALDITHLIRPGTLRIHISALEDVSDYVFVLDVFRPASSNFVNWEMCQP